MLAGVLRDLTARTTLVASLYQSTHDARQSCDEHALIVDALEAGDGEAAAVRMLDHIGSVESALGSSSALADPQERLRASLAPLVRAVPLRVG